MTNRYILLDLLQAQKDVPSLKEKSVIPLHTLFGDFKIAWYWLAFLFLVFAVQSGRFLWKVRRASNGCRVDYTREEAQAVVMHVCAAITYAGAAVLVLIGMLQATAIPGYYWFPYIMTLLVLFGVACLYWENKLMKRWHRYTRSIRRESSEEEED